LSAGSVVKYERAFNVVSGGAAPSLTFIMIQYGTLTIDRIVNSGSLSNFAVTRTRNGVDSVVTPASFPGNVSVRPGDVLRVDATFAVGGNVTVKWMTNGADIFPMPGWAGVVDIGAAP
jgi:hypothetical protein